MMYLFVIFGLMAATSFVLAARHTASLAAKPVAIKQMGTK